MPTPSALQCRACLLMAALRRAGTACGSFGDASQRIAGVVTPTASMWCRATSSPASRSHCCKPAWPASRCATCWARRCCTSLFHSDRWDYVFTFQRKGEEPQQRKVTVFFKDAGLERFEGDTLPSEASSSPR
jgi:outer membrane protein assembly factor BamE